MTSMDESELRRHFARLRDADQRQRMSFTETYGRARPARATLRVRTLVIGAAAVLAVSAVWLAGSRSGSSGDASTIASWRAPTDVFLKMPGNALLGVMPALGTSILDTMIPALSTKGGAEL